MMSRYLSLIALSVCLTGSVVFAEETVPEKIQTVTNKSVDKVKETYRNAQDKTCEMIKGKMKCVAKKAKNKAQTAVDKTQTKTKEIINKVD